MPWTKADVEKHKKGLNDKAAEVWVTVANKALATCLGKIDGKPSDEQRSRCEASAIKQANAVSGNMQESDMEILQIAQSAIEAGRSFVSGGKELVEATGQSPKVAMNALLDRLQNDLDGILLEAAPTKTVSGRTHQRGDFLIVEDPEKPTTWHLPVKLNGKPDHRLMGGAWAALHQGYRGQKYEGLGKQEAISKLRALYKSEDMEVPGETSEADMGTEVEEAISPAQVQAVLKFLMAKFGGAEKTEGPPEEEAPPADEEEEEAEPMAEVELAESASGQVIGLAEDALAVTSASIVPLNLNVAIIRPGLGNKKDRHYYPPETLRRDSAAVFPGIKMYESDHRDNEKSTRTWVSTVQEISGFTEDGAPIGRIVVHDKNFAERLLALNEAGLLGKMECSILGTGKVRKGTVDGEKVKIVEAITSARSVDWVTKAGAGGHALNLAEGGDSDMTDEHKKVKGEEEEGKGEQANPEAEAVEEMLSENAVASLLAESSLPGAAKDKLKAAQYKDEEAVKEAITAEVKYLEDITGAGQPKMHGDRERVTVEQMSEADYQAAYDEIRARHGLAPLYGGE